MFSRHNAHHSRERYFVHCKFSINHRHYGINNISMSAVFENRLRGFATFSVRKVTFRRFFVGIYQKRYFLYQRESDCYTSDSNRFRLSDGRKNNLLTLHYK